MSELRVYMRHARAARIDGAGVTCASGIRAWCDRNEVDLHEFATHGLPASTFERIGDAFCERMLAAARAEAREVPDGQK